jgi:amidase
MLDILSQPQPGDPFTLWSPGRPYSVLALQRRPLKIAVTVEPWAGIPVDRDIAAAVAATARLCEEQGHTVTWASPRFDFEAVLRVLTDFFAFGLANLEAFAGRAAAIGPDVLEPVTFANWEFARRLTAADLDVDLVLANQLRRNVGAFFADFDVLMTPALANAPPPHGVYSQSRTDVDPLGFMRLTQRTDQFLPVFNITGQPALSIPVAISSLGLPIGLQLVSRFAHEHVILALGREIMEAAPVSARPGHWAGR